MTTPVILLCFFLAFCPLSVGTPLTCPPSFLNESAQQGSGRLCATLQLQTKLPCPSVNLTVRENEKLNPEKWHLESLSLKVEKTCSFMVFKQDKLSQHFPGGFSSNIPINSIDTQSEFLCVCEKLHIRHRRAESSFYDFSMKHLVDNPADPSDNNYWQRVWDSATDYRRNVMKYKTIPPTQSFMDRRYFTTENMKKIFTRKYPIVSSNGRTSFRCSVTMDVYNVRQENGLKVDRIHGYVVVGLNNNDMPVHYERVIKHGALTANGGKAAMTAIREGAAETEIGGGTAVTTIRERAASIFTEMFNFLNQKLNTSWRILF
ncbi:uncharacterized protein LOC125274378 isoform X2 [Megalobrama amblycephala]|uniref:uncharacterized protein LOC125274378 isoform X1 n=1 Tax=Megalobrama amblycephala TaxID=75352 RepID=UPI0020146734|nr:uncharacterized protein LOC125274378 isoform X1 [Megalobrama amblycephala]XP_048056695.1 uncharacterized protein LOC125274378 isoform X2 [Megalobrama amblycephala]